MGKKFQMSKEQKAAHKEVHKNFEVFQKMLPKLMSTHNGQHALMHKRKIIEFFDTCGDAYKTGKLMFKDLPFSIQEVSDEVFYIY